MKSVKFFAGALLGLLVMIAFSAVGAASPGMSMAVVSPVMALEEYSGQYKDELFGDLLNGMDIAQDVTLETEVKSKLTFTKLTVSDGYRPYSSNEEIEGDELEYSGIVGEVHAGKRELSIDIKKYRKEWFAYRKRGEHAQKGAADIPFAQYTWMRVIDTLKAEINNKTAYHGFDKTTAAAFNAGTAYSVGDYMLYTETSGIKNYYKCIDATTAGQTPVSHASKWKKSNAEAVAPGLGMHLAELITAGHVAPVTTGISDNTNAYANLKAVWKAVPEEWKNKGLNCYISRNTYENFVEDYENRVSKYTDKDGATVKTLPGTDGKCRFVIASWMVGSNRIIMTPKENVYMMTDEESDTNLIEIVKSSLWVIKAGISNVIGFKFRDASVITCNDAV